MVQYTIRLRPQAFNSKLSPIYDIVREYKENDIFFTFHDDAVERRKLGIKCSRLQLKLLERTPHQPQLFHAGPLFRSNWNLEFRIFLNFPHSKSSLFLLSLLLPVCYFSTLVINIFVKPFCFI